MAIACRRSEKVLFEAAEQRRLFTGDQEMVETEPAGHLSTSGMEMRKMPLAISSMRVPDCVSVIMRRKPSLELLFVGECNEATAMLTTD